MALQNRPLRPFEKQAHLHILDFAHDSAKYRFQDAGRTQVKAAAKAIARGDVTGPPQLPALGTAITGELQKLYALGHATVRSELAHQREGATAVTVGLSAAPAPPGLRMAPAAKGRRRACATCKMFDHGLCWGYGNYPVNPNQLCDSYDPDQAPKTLAMGDAPRDLASLGARGKLVAEAVANAIHQAIALARLHGTTGRRQLRQAGEQAGEAALRTQASPHTGPAIMAGRHAAAEQAGEEIIGARYTSVLDKNTCGPCATADDGVLRPLDDPHLAPAPNPACLGGSRCRCIWVYALRREEAFRSGV